MPPKTKGKPKANQGGGSEVPDTKLKGGSAVKVRHILTEKLSKCEEALKKIQEDGMRFDKVAELYSEDKAKRGGDLGWQTRGAMVGAFQDVAFALKPTLCTARLVPLTHVILIVMKNFKYNAELS
ncbi:hypothetical protein SeLEV6574_g01952 [Synchytrium endobioticum]|uniref:Peptidyl-prolyl cis-trans isomerase n=1 Tax=Synchytrium endobioticum TaxID=286115 RepID=A0A507DAJ9_9FUNG|nr:hypothetical protein SeLEV6574_g01952 [Synchytrium endobioticum]